MSILRLNSLSPVKTPNLFSPVILTSVPNSPISYTIPGSFLLSIVTWLSVICSPLAWEFSWCTGHSPWKAAASSSTQPFAAGRWLLSGTSNPWSPELNQWGQGLTFFSHCCSELPDRSSSGKGGLIDLWLEVQSIMTGKVQMAAGVWAVWLHPGSEATEMLIFHSLPHPGPQGWCWSRKTHERPMIKYWFVDLLSDLLSHHFYCQAWHHLLPGA